MIMPDESQLSGGNDQQGPTDETMLSRSRWEGEESKGEGIPSSSKRIHPTEHINNEGAFRRPLPPPTGRLCRPPAS